MICRDLNDFSKLLCAPNGTKLELFAGGFEEVGCVVFMIAVIVGTLLLLAHSCY